MVIMMGGIEGARGHIGAEVVRRGVAMEAGGGGGGGRGDVLAGDVGSRHVGGRMDRRDRVGHVDGTTTMVTTTIKASTISTRNGLRPGCC